MATDKWIRSCGSACRLLAEWSRRTPRLVSPPAVIMVPVFFLFLLIIQLLFGACTGLLPELGRRKYSSLSRDALDAFELRLLTMFGLKHRPNPSSTTVIPEYMVDLFSAYSSNSAENRHHKTRSLVGRSAEKSASRANTVRSFHHEGNIISQLIFKKKKDELTFMRRGKTTNDNNDLTSTCQL